MYKSRLLYIVLFKTKMSNIQSDILQDNSSHNLVRDICNIWFSIDVVGLDLIPLWSIMLDGDYFFVVRKLTFTFSFHNQET